MKIITKNIDTLWIREKRQAVMRLHFSLLDLMFCMLISTSGAQPQLLENDSIITTFSLRSIDGKIITLTENLGEKITIVSFWATWGDDSIEMLDNIEKLYRKYHEKGLMAFGICVEQQSISDTMLQKIIDTVRKKQLSFPILIDDHLMTFNQYNVIAVPTTFILDEKGKIIYKLSGYPIVGRNDLYEFINQQFEKKQQIEIHRKYKRVPDKKSLRLYNLALMKFKKDELDTAKKYALKSIDHDTLFIQPLLLLAEIALQNNDLLDAEIRIDRSLKIDENSTDTKSLYGLLLAKKGETNKAIKILDSLIKTEDKLAIVHCYLGYAYGVAGDYDKAFDEFLKSETLVKNEYQLPMLRAEIYDKMGKHQEADADRKIAKMLQRMKQ